MLPHLAVPQLAQAITESSAQRVYVCNVMTQPGETDGFTAADHIEKVLDAAPGGVDMIVVHEGPLDPEAAAAYAAQGQEPVRVDAAPAGGDGRARRRGRPGRGGADGAPLAGALAAVLMELVRALVDPLKTPVVAGVKKEGMQRLPRTWGRP